MKTGLNNERTRVCLCPSGDAVHREEAAESSVSLYDLNFLCGSPLSWTPRGPLQPLCFTLSFSLWPLTSAGMCWLTLRVRLKSSPGLRLEPSSQRLWFVCMLLFSSSFCWSMTLSLYSSCVFQASSFPCVVIYVMDTSRSVNPVTFMSNMLYACRYITIRLLL